MSSQRAVRAASAFVEISGDDSKLRKTLGGIKSGLKGLATGAAAVAGAGVALAGAGLAVGVSSVFKFAGEGDKLEKMAARTGVSAESLSQLGFAAEQSGADLDTLGASLFRMQRRVANFTTGGGPAKRALTDLGFAADSFDGMGTEGTFLAITERLADVEDPALRAQYAFEILGDQAKALLPMLNGGADGINALKLEADSLGLTISTDQAAAAAQFSDAWNRIKRAVGAVFTQIGANLAPTLTDLAGRVLPLLVKGGRLVADMFRVFLDAVVWGAEMGASAIQYLVAAFPGLAEIVGGTFGGIADALMSGEYALAAKVLWVSLKLAWAEGVEALSAEWDIWAKAFKDTFADAITFIVKQWHKMNNVISHGIVKVAAYLGADIDADAVAAELDEMLEQQLDFRDRGNAAARAERDAAFESNIGAANADLVAAREEWAAATAEAGKAAEAAANEPSASEVAGGKFSELLGELRSGDIADRMESVASAPAAAGDLRTAAGASTIYGLLNRQGTMDARLVALQSQVAAHTGKLVKLTKSGAVVVQI